MVLGHEMAHSVIGHGAEQLTRASFIQVINNIKGNELGTELYQSMDIYVSAPRLIKKFTYGQMLTPS